MVIAAASVVVAGAVAKDERALQVGIDVVGRSAAMDADGHLLKELDGAGPQPPQITSVTPRPCRNLGMAPWACSGAVSTSLLRIF